MPSPWQVDCLLIRIQSLRTEILRVKNKDRPYSETDIVFDALVAVIDSRYARVENAMKVYAMSGRPLPDKFFTTVARELETIFKFFSYADRVDSPRIPFELIRSLSWVANYLFDEDCYTVVRLEPEYNYSILSCRREFEKKGWEKYWRASVKCNKTQSAETRWFFRVQDLVGAAFLVERLRSGKDPLSQYLRNQFGPSTLHLLEQGKPLAQAEPVLVEGLVDELNDILMQTSLYQNARFRDVRLSEETKTLIKQNPRGENLIRLNRLLLEDAYPSDLPTVLLLGFPSPDAGSTLVHALAAHEFGHKFAHIFEDDLNKAQQTIVSEIKSQYHNVLEDYLAGLVIKLKSESRDDVYEKGRKYVVALIDTVSKNWLTEIFSDLVAARLVGPPFLAAFDRIILGYGKASESYPSASLRRLLVNEYLKKSLPKILADPVWSQLFEQDRGQHRSSDEIFRVMEQVFERVIPKIEGVLLNIPSPFTKIDWRQLSQLVNSMEDHIDHLAPPSFPAALSGNVPDPERFWLLMFGAWHYRISHRFNNLIDSQAEGDPNRAEDILGNLVLHSLQSLELEARWKEKYSS
jgi:hypothetical protein